MTQAFTLKTKSKEDGDIKLKVEIVTSVSPRPKRHYETLDTLYGLPCLSIHGNLYRKRARTPFACGQIYDSFEPQTAAQKHLVEFWKQHHLNDMQAGTKRQQQCLKDNDGNEKFDYTNSCKILEQHNLLVDNGYKYGTDWLWREYPIDELEQLIKELQEEELA